MPSGDQVADKAAHRDGHWSTVIKERAVLVLGSVTVAGIALVAVGWVIQGSSYLPGLLMQLGTSMMLLVPLALLGLMLENRIRHAEEQLRSTAARLDTLTAVTRERIATSRRQRDDLFDAAKQAPQQDMVRALLEDAAEVGAVDPLGVRVLVPGTSLRLRFRAQGDGIDVQVEELDGSPADHLTWREHEPAEAFAQQVAATLRRLDRYPGDAGFDPTTMLRHLLDMVHRGVRARTGEDAEDLGHLIEIPNEQWAVSSEGLFALQQHYHIPARSIAGSHDDWPRHMRTLAWVDQTAFEEAYQLARRLLNRR